MNEPKLTENKREISIVRKSGIVLRFDKDVNVEVKDALKTFAKWLRAEFVFPVRMNVYVKACERIRARDGDKVCGVFFRPYNYGEEPYIKLATGDYIQLKKEMGRDDALASLIWTFSHELTHYFQYVNSAELTLKGEEIQASRYATKILRMYGETREHP